MKHYSKLLLSVLMILNLTTKGNAFEYTEVVFIASMHGAHKDHASYNYETLFSLVQSYNPDFVGVEIRSEDIDADINYLKSYYPFEMIELRQKYKGKVFGFDWLGYEINNQSIPSGYFKNLKVLSLARELDSDVDVLNQRPPKLNELEKLQETMIESATPVSFNNGEYGQICREIDTLEKMWLKGTPYIEIQQFHQTRDIEIGNNLISFIGQNKGKTIVVVLGADHRTFAIENVTKHFGDEVNILPVDSQTASIL